MSSSSKHASIALASAVAATLAATGEARAQGFAISPGIVFSGTFGDKPTFGLGLDLRVTGLVKGDFMSCDQKTRAGVGGFVQALWLDFRRAARVSVGAHGGGEAHQVYSLGGELGWTYRTSLGESPARHGLLFGMTHAAIFGPVPSPEVSVRGLVSWAGPRVVPEAMVALTGRWPATFGLSGICVSGRPLRLDGEIALPDVSIAGACEPRALRADPAARAAIAEAWLDDARAECASIPAFAALARDLASAGAPASLVHAALSAMADEIHHTALCASLAADLSGVVALPDLLAPPASRDRDRAHLLARLAVEAWEDGCLGEGAAAARARFARDAATDPATKAVLATIADDEQRHADLGRRVLAFCLAEAPDLRDLLADLALTRAPSAPAHPPQHDDSELARALGRIAPAEADAAWDTTLSRARAEAEILLAG